MWRKAVRAISGEAQPSVREMNGCYQAVGANRASFAGERAGEVLIKPMEELQASEAKYRQLLDDINDGCIVMNLEGKIVFANAKMAKILGYKLEELIGETARKFTPSEFIPYIGEIRKMLEQRRRVRERFEVTLLNMDGNRVSIEASAKFIEYEGEPAITAVVRDVTKRKEAEEALQESEKKYSSVVELSADGIVLVQGGEIIFANRSFYELLGFEASEIIGIDILSLISGDMADAVSVMSWDERQMITRRVSDEMKGHLTHQIYQVPLKTKSGEIVWVEIHSNPIEYEGKAAHLAFLRDVTERKRAEEELTRLSDAVKMSTDSIVISDLDGKMIQVNEATLKMCGTDDKGDLIGKNAFELIAPEDHEKALAITYETLEKGYIRGAEYHIVTKDGSRIPVWMSVALIKNMDGKPIGFLAISRDVTERKRAEEELRASEAKYRRLVEDMNDGYMVVNWRREIAFANGKLAEISGYKLKELIGEDAAKLAPPEFIPYGLKLARRLEQRRQMREHLEGALLNKDGERVPVEISLKAIEYEGGPAIALVVRGITERKRAEEALQESEEKYRHLFQDLTDAAFLADAETGLILETNVRGEALLGKSRHEIVGMHQAQLHPPGKADEYRRRFAKHIEKGRRADYDGEIIKKDGTMVPVRISASNLTMRGQRFILGLFRDITERKRAEEEIQRHTERIAVTAELTRIITSSLNIEDVYEAFADGVKRLVDFDRFSIVLVEGDKARLVAVVSAVETELRTGVIVPLEGSAAEWVVKNKRTSIETDFAQERQFPADEAHRRSGLRSAIRLPLFSRGEVIGTFNLSSRRSHAYGEREQEILEELAGRIAVAIENAQLFDEAQAKIEELKAAQEYLVQTERQRALAEMAGGVAHDFNNVLSIVLGRAQLALEDTKEPKLKESLQVIERSVYDAANMVRRLQEFTGATVGEKLEALDLNQVVKSALQMVETRRAENQVNGVKIDIDADLDEVYTVEGNPAELRGVLVNIIFNAMDALPQGGRIAVKTARENSWALISISDTGTGMTEEVKWRIFDPFFTTKGSRGSGLGLSASHGIISKHGGSIEIDSTLGKGSTFYIRLPIVNGTRRKARED